jgi:hypothetical protein
MWNPPIACLWFWKDTQAIVIRLDDIAQTFLIICQTIIHRDAALIWSTSSSMSSLFQEGASFRANKPIRSEYGPKGRQRDVDQPPTAPCPFSLLMLVPCYISRADMRATLLAIDRFASRSSVSAACSRRGTLLVQQR